MRILHVFPNKDSLRRAYDDFWQQHGYDVESQGPYRVTMRNGEEHRFVVIRGPDDHHRIMGQRFDDIDIVDTGSPPPEQTLRFLLEHQIPESSDE